MGFSIGFFELVFVYTDLALLRLQSWCGNKKLGIGVSFRLRRSVVVQQLVYGHSPSSSHAVASTIPNIS